jgi:DNA-binding transcriptional LysR family regulator
MPLDDQIGRRLRLKDLHTLQVVAEAGSMAKASRLLALSQPAISKAIADMEQMLGTALLDRSAHGVELTESGRALTARGRVIFDEVREGVKDIQHLSDPSRGEIRVGTTEPITSFLAEVISRMSRPYPRISFQVAVSDTTSLVRDLRRRDLDIVLTRWTERVFADDLAAEVLLDAPLAVLADRRHPLVKRKKLSLADTMEEAWTLSPPDSFLGQIVIEVFRRRKLGLPPTVVTTLSIHMRLNLLASGRFLTMLPERMVRDRANSSWLSALDIDLPDSSGPVAWISMKKRSTSGALKLFRGMCRDVSQPMRVLA